MSTLIYDDCCHLFFGETEAYESDIFSAAVAEVSNCIIQSVSVIYELK